MGEEATASWKKFCAQLHKEEENFINDYDATHVNEVLLPTLKRGSWGPVLEIQVWNPASKDRRGYSNLKRAINFSDNFKVSSGNSQLQQKQFLKIAVLKNPFKYLEFYPVQAMGEFLSSEIETIRSSFR